MVFKNSKTTSGARGGFTLFEVVISLMIIAIVFGAIIQAYIATTTRAEWTGYSLAAQSLAIQQIEQARSAIYDPPSKRNEILMMMSNLNSFSYNAGTTGGTGFSWTNLDLPSFGGNFVRATNYVTVARLTVTGVSQAEMYSIRVDTVWPFRRGNTMKKYTNTIATYVAADNPNL